MGAFDINKFAAVAGAGVSAFATLQPGSPNPEGSQAMALLTSLSRIGKSDQGGSPPGVVRAEPAQAPAAPRPAGVGAWVKSHLALTIGLAVAGVLAVVLLLRRR